MRLNNVTIYHIRSNSALRTPRYHGQFALSLGKDSSYELSWGWSRAVTPHRKEMFKKKHSWKRAIHGQIQGLLVFYQSYSHHLVIWYPSWNILFPVNCILRLYFSLGFRAWHWNLGLIIEKWAFGNFQGWPKKDTMRISCDSVSNIHWCTKHVKYN